MDGVKADGGQILGHAQAFHVSCAEHTDGGHVVGADDGCRARRECLQLAVACHAAFERVVALDDPFFLEGQLRRLHCRAEIVFARNGGVELVRAGKKGNLAVTQFDKVIDGRMNACGVVEQDGTGLGVIELELGEHDGHVAVHKLVGDRLFFAEGHYGNALNFTLEHAADAGGKNLWVAVGGTYQDFVSVSHSDLFEILNEVREEGIADVFNDDAEEAAAAGDERARMSVWEVIQLLDGLPDTLGKTLADQWRTVDGSGDSGYGDLGNGGDGANVRRFHGRLAGYFSRHVRILFHPNQV